MAQHFEIPIAFEFKPKRLRWLRTQFEIKGRRTAVVPPSRNESTGTLTSAARPPLVTPDPLLVDLSKWLKVPRGEESVDGILFSAHPDELATHFEIVSEIEAKGIVVDESLAELLVSFDRDAPEARARDAWAMRDELMRLPETNEALLGFLNRWGVWRPGELTLALSRFNLADFTKIDQRRSLECASPALIWQDRMRLKAGMLERPEVWLSNNAALGFSASRPHFPFLGVQACTCLRAVEITITLDHLRSVRSRICARPDCDNIFPVESKHGKRYCDQYCAHLESVRRTRAAAKEAKTTAQKRKK